MSWTNKDQEIIDELKNNNIDLCSLSETKKKGKGKTEVGNYVLIYSGVPREERAYSGVGLLIHQKFKQNIEEEKYINDRILQVTLKLNGEHLHILSVYAPDISKPREKSEEFYNKLQNVINTINAQDKILLMGDLNARIGRSVTNGITQRFNEIENNDNGDSLKYFCAANNMRINNTFFEHPLKYKYTWQNTRDQQSVIDYIITNRAIHPREILDVRTLNGANNLSDHKLVLCKLRINIPRIVKAKPHYINKYNIEAFENNGTRQLYINRLQEKIAQHPVNIEEDVDQQWTTLKNNIIDAANEAIGQRKIDVNKPHNTPWFTPEVKELYQRKKKSYIRYLRDKTPENWTSYKEERNIVNREIKKLKENYWESYTKGMERDMYGSQRRIWGMLRRNKSEIKDTVQTAKITTKEWEEYFEKLYSNEEDNEQIIIATDEEEEEIQIPDGSVETILKQTKNRKSPGPDNMNNEMLKYGGQALYGELETLFRSIIKQKKIPSEWKSSTLIPIFKKGQKMLPQNYRGITLLNSSLKIFTKLILEILSTEIHLKEEQQGFRRNRSTIDAIYILRQMTEKALEYNRPLYLCFIDMTKAFDKVLLSDIIETLRNRGISNNLIQLIHDMNTNCKTTIKVGQTLSKEININKGIRQGDSLSPFLFNLIMDNIIENLPRNIGYKMGNVNFRALCYADDAVLFADSEDDLQRLLYAFCQKAYQNNMEINIEKTKCTVAAKEPLRCKLEINTKIVEQVMNFNYLGSEITSNGNLREEVRKQTMKAARISGCIRDIIWRNKYLTIDSKARIYKTVVRPIMTYAAETRPDTAVTKQMMTTTEMKILRTIHGKTLHDRIRNEEIRDMSKIQDITKIVRQRRKYWNKHVDRMENSRLVKAARDNKPVGNRSQGRPPKRWRECWTSTSEEA